MSHQLNDQFQPQGPAAYASHHPTPPPPGQPRPRKVRNIVAIAAFAVAIAGFVFAVWEGAYILGWILLPIGFVLSLVALFQKNQPKKMAIAALIITIVGTIAGVMAFLSSAAKAFDDTFSGGEITATAPAEPGDAVGSEEGAEANELGTRANPYPLGTTIANDEWQVTVNSVDLNATKKIAAENPYNDAPEPGHTYALVNVTVTYIGVESGTPYAVSVTYVTSAGNVIHDHDKSVVEPDPLSSNELYTGASATGNIALHIPADDDGLLRVSPGLFGKEVFVAIR